jgi:hypothetical protein
VYNRIQQHPKVSLYGYSLVNGTFVQREHNSGVGEPSAPMLPGKQHVTYESRNRLFCRQQDGLA